MEKLSVWLWMQFPDPIIDWCRNRLLPVSSDFLKSPISGQDAPGEYQRISQRSSVFDNHFDTL